MSDYLYPEAVVYRIVVGDEFYIGSTVDITKRLIHHKYDLNTNVKCMKLYDKLRELDLGFDDIEITIIQNYPCNDKRDLRMREGIYQRELKPTLNTRIEGRTEKEWYEDTKGYYEDHRQEYRNNLDKDVVAEYNKKYYETNKHVLKKKENCIFCSKEISKYCMKVHHKTCPDRPSGST